MHHPMDSFHPISGTTMAYGKSNATHESTASCLRGKAVAVTPRNRSRFEVEWDPGRSGGEEAARLHILANEYRDVIHRRAGIEDGTDAGFLEEIKILLWNDAADEKQHVFHLVLLEEIRHARDNGIVCAGKNREANHVHVFLQRRVDKHVRRLAEPGIDDFHAGIAQRTGNYLGATVVAVQAGFGNKHADFAI